MISDINIVIQHNPIDNVAIAKKDLEPGSRIIVYEGNIAPVEVIERIRSGHKVALGLIQTGEPILRYGQVIGVAAQKIFAGEHVHTHNVQSIFYDQDYVFNDAFWRLESIEDRGDDLSRESDHSQRYFQGFLRSDGRVGTRNYIAVIASAQCAAQVCQRIANHFHSEYLKEYPNVDGVISLTHNGGCGQADYNLLRRTLAGFAKHPNIAVPIFVGLGCEGNQLEKIWTARESSGFNRIDQPVRFEIQALGGSQKTIQAGIDAIEAMLPQANKARRSLQPLSKLVVALECGGSDGWSGITANPLLGHVSDSIVSEGGTVVMAETPEVFGAEHLLLKRAANPEVQRRFIEKLVWWRDYVIRIGVSLEDNPSPGNKAGGLTNLCEKSLGAIAKSGSTPMRAVYDYAETIQESGFVFMDSPGNDPISVTGMVAGGCNLVLFTTGRGSVFGYKPAPSLKICTNTKTYLHMIEDMDFNAGRIIDDNGTIEDLSAELFDLLVAIASGENTKSEDLGLGEMEFVPWFLEGLV